MSFGKRWLLPLGILVICILVAVGLFVLKPSLTSLSSAEVVQPALDGAAQTSGEAEPTDCSDAAAADDTCHQGHDQRAESEPDGTRERPRTVLVLRSPTTFAISNITEIWSTNTGLKLPLPSLRMN